jgi:hypothetical protein
VLQLLQGAADSKETATFLHSKGRVIDISESAGAAQRSRVPCTHKWRETSVGVRASALPSV